MNSFDATVDWFVDMGADSILLSDYKKGSVAGEPYNSKTGESWSMIMISSLEEAIESKYPICCDENDTELVKAVEKIRAKENK